MKSIFPLLSCLLVLSVLAALALWLASYFGLAVGCAIYVVLTSSMTLIAGWLLTRSEVGVISWKNRAAGMLLPWSMFVGSGSPTLFLAKNAVLSALFGCLIAVCNPSNSLAVQRIEWLGGDGQENGWAFALVGGFTLLCWIVLLGAWSRLLQNRAARPSWQSLVIPPLAIATSICMRCFSMPISALIVVALPIMLALLPIALMIAGVLIGHLTGKPIRWN